MVGQSELQDNPQELYNIRYNTKFNIKVTMIIKTRSETASVFYSVRIIAFHNKN